MNTITKDHLKANPNLENVYETAITVKGKCIEISINPDDIEIEKTIELANRVIESFDFYESKAKKIIIQEYLEDYNENWRNEENDEPELDEYSFSKNLTLDSIAFLSDSSFDFFYSENGMFGNHLLIAQSLDGENFEYTMMYG